MPHHWNLKLGHRPSVLFAPTELALVSNGSASHPWPWLQHDQVRLLIGNRFLINILMDGRVVDRLLSVGRFAIHSASVTGICNSEFEDNPQRSWCCTNTTLQRLCFAGQTRRIRYVYNGRWICSFWIYLTTFLSSMSLYSGISCS